MLLPLVALCRACFGRDLVKALKELKSPMLLHTCSLTASRKCSLLRKMASFALPTRPDGTDLRRQASLVFMTLQELNGKAMHLVQSLMAQKAQVDVSMEGL